MGGGYSAPVVDHEAASLAGCVADVLGVDSSEVPGDAGAGLRRRLARRKLGPVPVAFPEGFGWPGRFLVLGRGVAAWAVSFGVSPGVVFYPAAETDGTLRPSLRPRSCWRSTIRRAGPDGPGVVELIALAAEAEGPMTLASSAEVVAGCEASATGARSGPSLAPGGADRNLILVEAEALEELAAGGVGLAPAEAEPRREGYRAGRPGREALPGRG